MLTMADWIVLGLLLVFSILGMLFGFGKGLKFFTGGIFGIIISIFICYALGGLIYNIGFVQRGLELVRGALEKNENSVCKFLLMIQLDIIIYYVALFIVVSIVRIAIVLIIRRIVEIDNMFVIIINKILGVVFFLAVAVILMLLVLWIISLIAGDTAESFRYVLNSKLKLDWLYEHNPFMTIIKVIKLRVNVPAN